MSPSLLGNGISTTSMLCKAGKDDTVKCVLSEQISCAYSTSIRAILEVRQKVAEILMDRWEDKPR
jgi:hypothetical protein